MKGEEIYMIFTVLGYIMNAARCVYTLNNLFT